MPAPAGRTLALAVGAALLGVTLAACGGSSSSSQPPAAAPSTTGPTSPAAGPSEGATAVSQQPSPSAAPASGAPSPAAGPLSLTSSAFHDGDAIPKANTCDGADRSPELRWTGAPAGTKALVLEVLDPDAHDWVHWLVLDLTGAPGGTIAADVGTGSGAPQQGRNSFGNVGWGGPCPPSGTHRYVFTLFALDAPLGLSGHPDRAAVDRAIAAHKVLGKTKLTGTYRRS